MALKVVWRPLGGLVGRLREEDIPVDVIRVNSEDGRVVVRAPDISGATFTVSGANLWIFEGGE